MEGDTPKIKDMKDAIVNFGRKLVRNKPTLNKVMKE